VEVHTETARGLGLAQGDVVEIASRHGKIQAPVLVSPGIAPTVIAMPMGQGHDTFTRFASGRGANAISILAPMVEPETGALAWAATRVRISKVNSNSKLILFAERMREHPTNTGRGKQGSHATQLGNGRGSGSLHRLRSLRRWRVTRKTISPPVGDTEAARGRAMHWIRIERYWEGNSRTSKVKFRPGALPAMRYSAPASPVCPPMRVRTPKMV
jgi:hypothetical protein